VTVKDCPTAFDPNVKTPVLLKVVLDPIAEAPY